MRLLYISRKPNLNIEKALNDIRVYVENGDLNGFTCATNERTNRTNQANKANGTTNEVI